MIKLDDELLVIFKEAIVYDQKKSFSIALHYIKSEIFLISFENYFGKDEMSNKTILNSFEFFYNFSETLKSINQDDSIYFIFLSSRVSKVKILEKLIDLSEAKQTNMSFEEFLNQKQQEDAKNSSIKLQDTTDQDSIDSSLVCPQAKAYVIDIDPKNIKIGINGVLKKKMQLVIIPKYQCQQNSINLIQLAKEVSLSFLGLIISNFFKEYLFSFLNNKDIFDVIRFHDSKKGEIYSQFENFFTTFNCKQFPSIYNETNSFFSNFKIKSFLIKNYTDSIDISNYERNNFEWLDEYSKQFRINIPSGIIGGLECKYNLIFLEYLMIVFFFLSCFIGLIYILSLHYHRWNTLENTNFLNRIKKMYNFFYKTFMNSLLLVYFYNLGSFCVLMKLVRSIKFGMFDFIVLLLRGGFITFPLFDFYLEIYQKSLKDKENLKNDKNDVRTNFNQTNRYQNDKIQNIFYKDFKTKQVFASWIQKNNTILLNIRISLKKLFDRHSKKILTSNRNTTKKYILQINQDKIKPKKTQNSRKL